MILPGLPGGQPYAPRTALRPSRLVVPERIARQQLSPMTRHQRRIDHYRWGLPLEKAE